MSLPRPAPRTRGRALMLLQKENTTDQLAMLTIIPTGSGFLHYRISGGLSAADMEKYYRTLECNYRTHGKIRLLVEVSGFTGYADLRCIWLLVTREYKLLYQLSHYVAVANQCWFRKLVNSAGRLVPGVKIRALRFDEIQKAEAFLNG